MQSIDVSVKAGDEMKLRVRFGDVCYEAEGIIFGTEVRILDDEPGESLRFMVELCDIDKIVVSEVTEGV